MTCRSEREHSLILGDSGYTPEVSKDHVVLWPLIKPTLVLSFRGSIDNPVPVVGQLYEKHWELVGNHIPFHRYLNIHHPNQLTALLDGKYGVLAEGPEPLILAYQQVLKEFGFQASTMKRASRYWDGQEYVERNTDLVALIVGQSYVIASSVEAVEAE